MASNTTTFDKGFKSNFDVTTIETEENEKMKNKKVLIDSRSLRRKDIIAIIACSILFSSLLLNTLIFLKTSLYLVHPLLGLLGLLLVCFFSATVFIQIKSR